MFSYTPDQIAALRAVIEKHGGTVTPTESESAYIQLGKTLECSPGAAQSRIKQLKSKRCVSVNINGKIRAVTEGFRVLGQVDAGAIIPAETARSRKAPVGQPSVARFSEKPLRGSIRKS